MQALHALAGIQSRAWSRLITHAVKDARLDPGLVVQVRDVELLAGRMRQQLVVLLQDLVEALRQKKPQDDDHEKWEFGMLVACRHKPFI